MILHNYSYRAKAVLALHSLVGGPARERVIVGVPVAIELPDARLLIVTGDNERALAPSTLQPLAARTGWSVLATWVDPMLSGSRFLLDAVVLDAGKPRFFAERVLFQTGGGKTFLVGETGNAPAVEAGAKGLHLASRQPYRGNAERLIGIVRGQALLQDRVYAGTPYATPLARNLDR